MHCTRKHGYNASMSSIAPIEQDPLELRIERSNRKTIELRFLDANTLLIKTPMRTSQARINEVLQFKATWIAKTRKLKAEVWPVPKMADGEPILFLGEWHRLQIINTSAEKPDTQTPGIIKISPALAAKGTATLVQLYRDTMRELSHHYADIYTKRWNLSHNGIRISGARTRWGSCGPNNSLNFSWRLAMAPLLSIENVVAHELAHTVYRNHRAEFWKLLKKMMPRYEEGQAWLKQNAHRLPVFPD